MRDHARAVTRQRKRMGRGQTFISDFTHPRVSPPPVSGPSRSDGPAVPVASRSEATLVPGPSRSEGPQIASRSSISTTLSKGKAYDPFTMYDSMIDSQSDWMKDVIEFAGNPDKYGATYDVSSMFDPKNMPPAVTNLH